MMDPELAAALAAAKYVYYVPPARHRKDEPNG
jgi:hypothetical protein